MITLVLPCLDEVNSLQWIHDRLLPDMTMLVADNGSTDGSQAKAKELGAQVIDVPKRGYGAAVHAGIEAAPTDLVAVIDTDMTQNPADLLPLIDAVKAGADLAVCRRRATSHEAWPWHARAGNAFLSWRLRRKTGLSVRDLGPARVFHREAYLDLGVQDRAFGFPMEFLVRAAEANWRVVEIPMPYYPRTGESKVTGSLRGSIRATRDLLRATP